MSTAKSKDVSRAANRMGPGPTYQSVLHEHFGRVGSPHSVAPDSGNSTRGALPLETFDFGFLNEEQRVLARAVFHLRESLFITGPAGELDSIGRVDREISMMGCWFLKVPESRRLYNGC